MAKIYDVLIVGGGPAGLQSALTLGRVGRSVLLCDDDGSRNTSAKETHYFLTRDGTPPAEFHRLARADVEKYEEIEIRNTTVTSIEKSKDIFTADLKNDSQVQARKLILATGVVDELPHLEGLRELWGKTIFHCPYCHAYEFKGTAIGIIANGEEAFSMAALMCALTSDLVVFTNGLSELTKEQYNLLRKKNILIFEDKITGFKRDGEQLIGIEFENKEVVLRQGLLYRPSQKSEARLAEKLDCKMNDMGLFVVDTNGRSTQKDIYIAGDSMDKRQAILSAAYTGMIAAISVSSELAEEDMLGQSQPR